MKLPVFFRREAQLDFDAAANWYEQRRLGSGAVFAAAVREALIRIAEQPKLYAEVVEGVRESLLPGYPYCIYFREEPTQLTILAVFHTSRNPSIWQDRK
jgi:plasmid stabilization system protein ParE